MLLFGPPDGVENRVLMFSQRAAKNGSTVDGLLEAHWTRPRLVYGAPGQP